MDGLLVNMGLFDRLLESVSKIVKSNWKMGGGFLSHVALPVSDAMNKRVYPLLGSRCVVFLQDTVTGSST
jgi:hypothetical protein